MSIIARIDSDKRLSIVGNVVEYPSELESAGRNLVLNSDTYIDRGSKSFNIAKDASELNGKTVTSSVDIEVENAQIGETFNRRRIGFEFSLMRADGTKDYYGAWKTLSEGETFKGRISVTFNILNRDYVEVSEVGIHVQILGGLAKCGRPKLEKGSTATPWTPAPEDIGLTYPNDVQYFSFGFKSNGDLYTNQVIKSPNQFSMRNNGKTNSITVSEITENVVLS